MLSSEELEKLDKVKEVLSLGIERKYSDSFQDYLKKEIEGIIIGRNMRMGAINLPPEKIISLTIYILEFGIVSLAGTIKKYLDKNKDVKILLKKNGKSLKYGMSAIQIGIFLKGAYDTIS